jgi:diacylglycerol kinase (ATP)
MLDKFFKSFIHALRGFKTTWNEERNFRTQVVMASLVILGAYFFHFSYTEFSVIVIAAALVLSGEVINSAIEDLCNKIEPGHDSEIAKIKDVMAAFVLILSAGAFVLGIISLIHHFYSN